MRRPAARPASTYSRPKPAPSSVPQKQQQPSSVPAPQQSGGGGILSGIGSTIAQGMAFGTGSAVAHRAVGAVANGMGGGGEADQAAAAPEYAQGAMPSTETINSCSSDKTAYYECLKETRGDQEACRFFYEQLQQCQQNAAQFS